MSLTKQNKGIGQRGIEWTEYTWNPVGGCQHDCKWTMPDGSIAECYAKGVANKFRSPMFYENGFRAHYWKPERLGEPQKLRYPAKIFLDSMSDLMGHWVPDEQIEQVLEACRQTPQHTFQLLTKNPPRLRDFAFPDNVWVGISVPPTEMFGRPLTGAQQTRWLEVGLSHLQQVRASVRWLSIEPLSFDVADCIRDTGLQWAVIGAATNGARTFQPRPEWVTGALDALDAQGAGVFFKGNLKWPGAWREEWPKGAVSL